MTSMKYDTVPLPSSSLDVSILDHHLIGEGAMYDEHIFTIEVHVEQICYTVDRTYVDFVHLHTKIRKIFPQCAIPALPLDATLKIQKQLLKESPSKRKSKLTREPSRNSVISKRESIERIDSGKIGDIPTLGDSDLTENVSGKLKDLQLYIRSLLTFHEIVVSQELNLFLDEEISSPAIDCSYRVVPTEQDILLGDVNPTITTVRNYEDIKFEVRPGQLVVWRFSTEKYDIGFSVEIDDEVKVSNTRYKSHEGAICGSIEACRRGVCKLKWDNSYAKIHSKLLTYAAKVVEASDYNIAKEQVLNEQREKRRFDNQRSALYRATLRHAAAVSGVIHNYSAHHILNEEETMYIREMEDSISRIQKEKETAHLEAENLYNKLEDVLDQKAAIDDENRRLSEELMKLQNMVDDAYAENYALKNKLLESEKMKTAMTRQIAEQAEVIEAAKLAADMSNNKEKRIMEETMIALTIAEKRYKDELLEAQSKCNTLTSQLQKLEVDSSLTAQEYSKLEKDYNSIAKSLKLKTVESETLSNEVQKLRAMCEESDHEAELAQKELTEIRSENYSLKQSISMLEVKLNETISQHNEEIELLKASNPEAVSTLKFATEDFVNDSYDDLDKDAEYKSHVESLETQIRQLIEKNRSLEETLASFNTKQTLIQEKTFEEISKLNRLLSEYESTINAEERKILEYQTEVASLQTANNQLQEENDQHAAMIVELHQVVANVRLEAAEYAADLLESAQREEKQLQHIKKLESFIKTSLSPVPAPHPAIQRSYSTIETSSQHNGRQPQQKFQHMNSFNYSIEMERASEQNEEISRLRSKLDEEHGARKSAEKMLEYESDKLRKAIRDQSLLSNQVEVLQSEKLKLAVELESFRQNAGLTMKKEASLHEEIIGLQEQISKLSRENSQYVDKFSIYESELRKVKFEREEAVTKAESYSEQLNETKKKLNDLRESFTQIAQPLHKLLSTSEK